MKGMTIRARDEVIALSALGRMPAEDDEQEGADERVESFERRLRAITPLVSVDEARLMVMSFPESEESCFVIAWSLLHSFRRGPTNLATPTCVPGCGAAYFGFVAATPGGGEVEAVRLAAIGNDCRLRTACTASAPRWKCVHTPNAGNRTPQNGHLR
jgi:hypothetical protein